MFKIDPFIERLLGSEDLEGEIVHVESLPSQKPDYRGPEHPFHPLLKNALKAQGINRLYCHQAEALDALRRGENVLAVTPTASGKSLIYHIPVLEAVLKDPSARALFLFPTKALEQDQLKVIRGFLESLIKAKEIQAEIFDGDTPGRVRERLKASPPNILLSNPDMLHLALLAFHEQWANLFSNLKFVVIDELHTYRGIFGSHLCQVLRRLRRLCRHYGSNPRFIATSATIANPQEFAEALVGLPFHLIDRSGAPSQGKRFLLINPVASPYTLATRLFIRCVHSGLKTICFTKARKITELIYAWALETEPSLMGRIAPYRGGYRPEERREIERALFSERLSGVIATSALELGIDVGGLDACILVGYPGSISSTFQRAGRVGRGREAVILLVGLQDALDQYFMHHPRDLFGRAYEAALADPKNKRVFEDHLVLAAAELPLSSADGEIYGPDLTKRLDDLEAKGKLKKVGEAWHSFKRHPQRSISIRSIGEGYLIVGEDGRAIGTVDGTRALRECHPGAIYLHQGRSYEILRLDLQKRRALARPSEVDYYTQALSEEDTEVLASWGSKRSRSFQIHLGRLRVTERIVAYEKRRVFGGGRISRVPLHLPPKIFETTGLWLDLGGGIQELVLRRGFCFLGGLHAAEHALIALFPLFALCDRWDLGGISYEFHPQVGGAAIFVYDGYPDGIGLAERAYGVIGELFTKTFELLRSCPCEGGCPSCIQSPKCGSGNHPLDKEAATLILQALLGKVGVREGKTPRKGKGWEAETPKVLFFHLKTQRAATEVGGWEKRHLMGLAVAAIHDPLGDGFRFYMEEGVHDLYAELCSADLVIGFNLRGFDYEVLKGYPGIDVSGIRTFDILEDLKGRLGICLSLDHLAQETLGMERRVHGLKCLEWFKAGQLDKVIGSCKEDLLILKRLYEFGREQGYLLYRDSEGRVRRLPVEWPAPIGRAKGVA